MEISKADLQELLKLALLGAGELWGAEASFAESFLDRIAKRIESEGE
jgi:hypothetical protein